MTSINTNAAAQVALATLRGINLELSTLNDQISTGRRVNDARDNASSFAISSTIDADIQSFRTLQESIALGDSSIGVARSASESIKDLLIEAKGRIAAAQEENVDRTAIQADIDGIEAQIQGIVESASFNGLNLIQGGEALEVLSSFNRGSDGTVTPARITIAAANLSTLTLELDETATVDANADGNFAAIAGANQLGFETSDADVTTTTGDAVDATGGLTNLSERLADAAISDTETVTLGFAANADISAGDTFEFQFTAPGETTARTFVYVAQSDDTTAKDVIDNFASQLRNVAGVDGLDVASNTSDLTTDVQTLTVTNNTGGDLTAVRLRQTNDSNAGSTTSTGSLSALAAFDVTTTEGAQEALAAIDGLIDFAVDTATAFGSAQNRLTTQSEFITSLVDNLELGQSALVDADLTAASARLNALQVQQQLGLQSLSIANQAPQTILALFR